MSMRKQPLGDIPENTARVARKAFKKGNVCTKIADELGTIYEFSDFAEMFPAKGQPAVHPVRLILVTILQFAEGLSDRQAVEAVRARIDWKYLLHLDLEDDGFDFSVLSEFRDRVLAHQAGQTLFDKLLAILKEKGLIKAKGKQRTDSTHVLAAIRDLNRLEFVHETMRDALESLATVAPSWLISIAPPVWPERYGRRLFSFNSPKTDKERDKLVQLIGADGFSLLAAIDAAKDVEWLDKVPAVVTLRMVWEQQFTKPPGPPRFLEHDEQPPSAERIVSPHDTDARFSMKQDTEWNGYKAHFTETCDENLPRIITNTATTLATRPDWGMLPEVHQALQRIDLLPADHLVDTGYVSAASIVSSQRDYNVRVIGPPMEDSSWQAKENGFDKSYFEIDWEKNQATCPGKKTSRSWATDKSGMTHIAFKPTDCYKCKFREICVRGETPAGHPLARHLILKPKAEHEALMAARAELNNEDFWLRYKERSGIEGTISQAVRTCDARRSRYIGLKKTEFQNVLIGLAINVTRLGQWLLGTPLAKTRKSRLLSVCAA
jgi:transposase